MQRFDVVIVGGGPRGLATLERLDARVRAAGAAPVRVAMVDAVELGAGATWRTDQPSHFLNNTTSNATTIYPDASTPIDSPLGEGPTFLEWARMIAAQGAHELDWVVAEARAVHAHTFPTRRLQGVYYREQLRAVAARGGVQLTEFLDVVIDVTSPSDDAGAPRAVLLDSGVVLGAGAVVLAQGMVQAQLTAEEQGFASAAQELGLIYLPPGMPAEQAWHSVQAGKSVVTRGLGANFYDVVAELTAGRGGRFVPVPGDPDGRLRYAPSGREPQIWASSPRGLPYRAKGDYGSALLPSYEPEIATPQWFDDVSESAPHSLDFAADLWPTIATEFAWAWLRAQLQRELQSDCAEQHQGAGVASAAQLDPHAIGEWLRRAADLDRQGGAARAAGPRPWQVPHIDEALAQLTTGWADTFTIDELRRPTRGTALTAEQWEIRVRHHVETELDSLAHPLASPRQAVSRAMAAIRGRVAKLAARGMISEASLVRDLQGWWNAESLFLASGAPAQRVRETLALVEAGVVRFIGPETVVTVDREAGLFRAHSPLTGVTVTSRTLAEARMSKGKVPRTRDPLLRALLDRGDARVHTLEVHDGGGITGQRMTESVEAVPPHDARHPLSLVNRDGIADPRVLVLGIPAQSTQPGSTIGAAPGVPSPLLTGADTAARVALAHRNQAQHTPHFAVEQPTR